MSDSDTALCCPGCGASTVRRSRRISVGEGLRMMLGIYPFRCIGCGERFWANVWMFNSWRWAKCPRCLNLNLTDWPKRHYHISTWSQIMATLGSKKHRCTRCRNNFMSFRPRLPAYQGHEADADDLDFDAERQIPTPAKATASASGAVAGNPAPGKAESS
jgi:hypothetical protein